MEPNAGLLPYQHPGTRKISLSANAMVCRTANQHPNSLDYEQLEIIYSHQDSKTTVSSASVASNVPAAASEGDLNSKAAWGRKIREFRHGKLELRVHGFGDGTKVNTLVIRTQKGQSSAWRGTRSRRA